MKAAPDGMAPAELTGQPASVAIPRLLESHGSQIYGLGLRLCHDPDNARDLVQETFVRACEAWDGFEGRSRPSTWLYTIAVRACRRLERRRAGEPRHMRPLEKLLPSGDIVILDLPDGGDTPLEWTERQELISAVRRAVRSLPIDFRLPIVLKEMEGLSVEEVAEILGVKPATVKTRLHRGRLRIRQELAVPLAVPLATRSSPGGQDAVEDGCLDLLWAKQEAMDHGVEFPIPSEHLCARCRSVFATLDLGADLCRRMERAEFPAEVRRAIAQRVGATI